MAEYRLSPRAKRDLRDIWRTIAMHNESAADKLLLTLFDKFELFAEHPHMGPARPEIGEIVRLIVVGKYLAIYEPTSYGIEVVAVVHGMRDPESWV